MKTILLTGATGFLGSHLLEALLAVGNEVIILKRSNSNTWRIDHVLKKTKSYDVDLISLSDVFAQHSFDTIIHLATLYRKFDTAGLDVSEMVESNVSFPTELLELGARNNVKCFFNTGTFFEYNCAQLPVNECAAVEPFNFYAKTKLAFEAILSTYSKQLNIKTFRLFSPYGEKDNDKLIPMIIRKALSDDRIELSDGLQKLDFIYVGDIVNAYLKALDSIKEGQASYRVYNIGSGVGVSVREVVSIVEQQLGKTLNKVWGKPSEVDASVVFADISRAGIELDWKPKTSIHDGIAKSILFYKSKDASCI